METRYRINDEDYAIRVQPNPDGTLTAHIGEAAYTVTVEEKHGALHLLIAGEEGITRRVRALTAADGDKRCVALLGTGETFAAERVRGSGRRTASGGASSGTLTAQMPGQVMAVHVAVGDAVAAGQTLLVLEAMKMEMRVTAPFDGQVTALLVEEGHTVERGQRVAELTPNDES